MSFFILLLTIILCDPSPAVGASAFPVVVQQDDFKAILKSAKKGDAEAQYKAGLHFYNSKDYGESLKWFLKAAEQEHAMAQFYLGYMYYYGYGVNQAFVLFIIWV